MAAPPLSRETTDVPAVEPAMPARRGGWRLFGRSPRGGASGGGASSGGVGGGASTGGSRWRRRLLRAAIVLAVLVALYAAAGFLLVPWIARGQIEKQLGAQLDRVTSVGKVTFNPFKLDASVQDLLVRDRDGSSPFVQFARLDVDVSWRSLTALAPVLAGLRLVEPKVALRREPDGRYNFQDLIDKWSNQPSSEEGPTPHFSLSNIVLENGRVDFDDRAKDSRHAVSAINIGVPFISSLPVHEQLFVEPHVSAEVDGSRFAADGKTRPFEPDRPSTLQIDLDEFDLLRLVPYSPVPLPVTLKSGRLSLANTIEFSQPPDGTPHVRVTGDLRLDDIDVAEKGGEPLLKFKALAADGLTFALVGRRLELRRLALQSPQVVVQRRAGQTQFFESVLAGIKPAGKEPAAKESEGKEPARPASAAPGASASSAPAFNWKVDEIAIDGARVEFLDELFKPKPLRLNIDPLAANVKGLAGGAPAEPAQWQVDLRNEGGETVKAQGTAAIEPMKVAGEFRVEKVRLAPWWWVAAPTVALDVAQGDAAADGHFAVDMPAGGEAVIRLDKLGLQLRDLALDQRWDRTRLLSLASLKVADTSVDLAGRAVQVGSIDSSGGKLLVRRERDGRLNVQRLTDPASIAATPPPERAEGGRSARPGSRAAARERAAASAAGSPGPAASAAAPSSAKPASPAASAPSAKAAASAPAAAAKPDAGWTVVLARGVLDQYAITVEDRSTGGRSTGGRSAGGRSADLKIDSLRLMLENLSTAQGAQRGRIELTSRVGARGALAVAGRLGLAPVGGQLAIDARDIGVLPAQPYFTGFVNARVSGGALSAKGSLTFDVPPAGSAKVAFKGDAGINDFASVMKTDNTDLLRWKSLQVKTIDFVAEPQRIHIGEVALDDFYSRLIISPEGRLNVQDLMVRKDGAVDGAAGGGAGSGGSGSGGSAGASGSVQARSPGGSAAPAGGAPSNEELMRATADPTAGPAPSPAAGTAKPLAPPPEGPPPDLLIGRIVLTNGNIDFSDFFVKPNYSANLTGMNGSIGQISPRDIGDLTLKGKVDNLGSVDISGRVNPLAQTLFLDIVAHARDIDLPRLSPYSVKYVGYGIEKGKLSATVKYKIVDRMLSAENNVVLDQLTFGEKVDSPTALKLPVLFAVSLLKDRNGVIDVNMPISGSLDDPQFSIAGLVLRIIGNLIVKAVTSPFSLLASLGGGGGEELSFLEFEPGRATLNKSATDKLQSLAKALTDRPALKMDLTGRADPATDKEALRKLALERQLAALKRRAAARAADGAAGGSDDDTEVLSGAERTRFLTQAYRNATFERPRNALRMLREMPDADMERMLLEHTQVSDSDVSDLASRRAQRAKDWLIESGKIDGERLFVLAPKTDAKEVKGAGPARVDLSLK